MCINYYGIKNLFLYFYFMDNIYKALWDKNRRKILEILKNWDLSVWELLKKPLQYQYLYQQKKWFL